MAPKRSKSEESKKSAESKDQPPREKFKLFISETKPFKSEEAKSLRAMLKGMVFLHIYFLIADLLMYPWEVLPPLSQLVFIWLSHRNFKTLFKPTVFAQAAMYGLASLIAVS